MRHGVRPGLAQAGSRDANCASVVGRRGAGPTCFPVLICCVPTIMLDVFRRFIAPLVPPYQYRITLYRSSNAISELSGFVALVGWDKVAGELQCSDIQSTT
jgi:hypothetical protein